MNAETTLARQIVIERVLDAKALPEIDVAREALRAWLRAHPDDDGIKEAFDQLSLMEDIASDEMEASDRLGAQQELQPT